MIVEVAEEALVEAAGEEEAAELVPALTSRRDDALVEALAASPTREVEEVEVTATVDVMTVAVMVGAVTAAVMVGAVTVVMVGAEGADTKSSLRIPNPVCLFSDDCFVFHSVFPAAAVFPQFSWMAALN